MTVGKIGLVTLSLLGSIHCFAEIPTSVRYYTGVAWVRVLKPDAISPSPNQFPPYSEEVLLKRVVDPSKGFIVELGCFSNAKNTYPSAMYLQVQNNQGTVSDTKSPKDAKYYTGTVDLAGPIWNWNYLKFDMKWLGDGSTIEDVNFVTDHRLIARKKQYTTSNLLILTYDVDADEISEADFNKRLSDLKCPDLPTYP